MNVLAGWIKVHRELLEKAIWVDSTPEQKVILITLLMMANHKEKQWEWQGQKYNARPGQFVTSLASIQKRSGEGVSIQNVRTALLRFEKYEFLTNESTNKNRLVTIINWEIYQQNDEHPTNNLTGDQQATNRQLTTNKNVRTKERKNENISSSNMVDSNLAEVIQFYESNFGMIPSSLTQVIPDDYDRYGRDLMIEAMNRSVLANKRSYGYVLGILRNWASKNAKTIEDVQALEVEFANQKTKGSFGRKTKEEKVPEWFDKQKADRAANNVVEDSVTPEFEEQKQQLFEKLGIKQ